jgi:hypothetical protein
MFWVIWDRVNVWIVGDKVFSLDSRVGYDGMILFRMRMEEN